MSIINSRRPVSRPGTATIDISSNSPGDAVVFLFGGNSYIYQPGTPNEGESHTTESGEYPFDLYDISTPDDESRFEAFRVPINRNISFLGSFRHTNKAAIEYRWDLGDGSIKYGPSVRHRYISMSPEVCVRLKITFEDGSSIRSNENIVLYDPIVPDPVIYPDTGIYPDEGEYPG